MLRSFSENRFSGRTATRSLPPANRSLNDTTARSAAPLVLRSTATPLRFYGKRNGGEAIWRLHDAKGAGEILMRGMIGGGPGSGSWLGVQHLSHGPDRLLHQA